MLITCSVAFEERADFYESALSRSDYSLYKVKIYANGGGFIGVPENI
jgi:hypothetical protein